MNGDRLDDIVVANLQSHDLTLFVSRADRRVASGQAEGERRKADRRQKPPFTWEVGDFVVKDATGQGKLKTRN